MTRVERAAAPVERYFAVIGLRAVDVAAIPVANVFVPSSISTRTAANRCVHCSVSDGYRPCISSLALRGLSGALRVERLGSESPAALQTSST